MKYPKQANQMSLIGSHCTFDRELQPRYFENGGRKWIRGHVHKKYVGKIVGFGCNYNGKYIPRGANYKILGYDEPAHFVPSKRVGHVKVRIKGEGIAFKVHPMDCRIIKGGTDAVHLHI